jgi:Mg-chelatase subunit ChlD
MKSVVENDTNTIDDGKLVSDVINQGFSSFTPDMMFDNLVKDYSVAKSIFGESLIRLVSGEGSEYVKKNINIPEFRRELFSNIQEKFKDLQKKGFLNDDYEITDKGYTLSSLILYTQELEKLKPMNQFGEKITKTAKKKEFDMTYRNIKKGDRYKDIAIKRSIKKALRRGSQSLDYKDLQIKNKKSRGAKNIIYAIDSSGSMKGKKIEAAKKAGIALMFHAIEQRDKVGLISFGKEVNEAQEPTLDFGLLLNKITRIRAANQTDMVSAINTAIEIFSDKKETKHLIILTDAIPTIGTDPQKEVLESVSSAKNHNITISIIGLNLDEQGEEFAQKVVEISQGNVYIIKDLENLDTIILENYYNIQ